MKKVILAVVIIAAAGVMTPKHPVKTAMGKRTEGPAPCFPVCGEQKLIAQHSQLPFGGRTE